MNTNTLSARRAAGTALAALVTYLLSPVAMAQQQPITGQMMDGRTTTVAIAPSAPLPPPPQAPHPASTTALPAAGIASTIGAAPSTPSPSTDYAAAPAYYATQVGDTTRHLLQMQARGDRAGQPRPMLGTEASASYQRYLKSFEHPIPEFYEATVGKNSRSGR